MRALSPEERGADERPTQHGKQHHGHLEAPSNASGSIEVGCFYDLSRPGEYSLQGQREFPEIGKEALPSNRLEFAITP